jgi:hypothetical protein
MSSPERQRPVHRLNADVHAVDSRGPCAHRQTDRWLAVTAGPRHADISIRAVDRGSAGSYKIACVLPDASVGALGISNTDRVLRSHTTRVVAAAERRDRGAVAANRAGAVADALAIHADEADPARVPIDASTTSPSGRICRTARSEGAIAVLSADVAGRAFYCRARAATEHYGHGAAQGSPKKRSTRRSARRGAGQGIELGTVQPYTPCHHASVLELTRILYDC